MINNIKRAYKRFQRRKDPSLPDKCDTCALRVEYTNNPQFEAMILKVAELDKLGLARYSPRTINLSNVKVEPTFFCALANLRYWRHKNLACPDWQLRLPGSSTSLSEYLAIHHTRVSMRKATKLQWIVIAFAVVALLLSALGIWIAHQDAVSSLSSPQ